MQCTKIKFASREEAQINADRMNQMRAASKKYSMSVYFHKPCKAWHMGHTNTIRGLVYKNPNPTTEVLPQRSEQSKLIREEIRKLRS